MKAVVIHAEKDVRVEERDASSPGADQVAVEFAWGGICGSDIHYFLHGRVGDSIVRNPMVLGHEFSGIIRATGSRVSDFEPGDKVAVNPARPCGVCESCRKGLTNLCTDVQFMGSAARADHCDGGFSESNVLMASQCVKIPADADLRHVAMAEPFAVALHAVALARHIEGANVLIAGAGVIGQMTAIAARQAGAKRIVMCDISREARDRALQLGIDEVFDSSDPYKVSSWKKDIKFDVAFEASGAPAALDTAILLMQPRGQIVQIGFLPPKAPLQLAKLLTSELTLTGAYRFVDEFDRAVSYIVNGEVDLRPLISAEMLFNEPEAVFARAADKSRTLKVMVRFQ